MLHPASIDPRRLPARKMVNILLARSAGTRINMIWQSVTSGPATAAPGLTPSRRPARGDSFEVHPQGAQ
jgi:hypothetical protein